MNPTWIALSDPDITHEEIDAVADVLRSPQLSSGPVVQQFEAAFAKYVGRKHAVAVASGTLGLVLALQAGGIARGDEVVGSPYSWRECGHAIALSGARPVFADIDYWSGTLVPEKAEACVGARTKAIVAANANGHPAAWDKMREVSRRHRLLLIEDSTEAIGSIYQGKPVGSFGDVSVFDFSQPGPLACGEGGMVVTDDDDYAGRLRRLRSRRTSERSSVVFGLDAPFQCAMSDLAAALGIVQLQRIDTILAKRKRAEQLYYKYVQSFEGIKDPYVAPEADEVHWFLYAVHLGTRFTRSSRDAIVEDLRTESIDACAYCEPMHLQRRYLGFGYRRGSLPTAEKIAERAVALPFHTHLTEEQIAFVIGTMKDASINVGAGTAIYL